MKNPWKKLSKVNPQREEGNRQISSEVFERLIRANLNGGEFKIVLAIIHKTWGFNKISDTIPIFQLQEMTGLADRTVKLTIKQLKDKRIIYYEQSKVRVHHGSPMNEFIFNKHYDTWLDQGCKPLHACKGKVSKGAKSCQVRVQDCSPSIEILSKENINTSLSLPSEADSRDSSSMSPHEVNTASGNSSEPEKSAGPLTSGVKAKKRPATNSPPKKTPNSEIRMFVNFVDKTYQRKFNFPFIFSHGKDEKIIQELLVKFSLDKLKDFWLKYLDLSDEFLDEEGRDIGKFKLKINKMTSGGKNKQKPIHHDGQHPVFTPEQEKAEQVEKDLKARYYAFLAEQIPLTEEQIKHHRILDSEEKSLIENASRPEVKQGWLNTFSSAIRLKMLEECGLPDFEQWKAQLQEDP